MSSSNTSPSIDPLLLHEALADDRLSTHDGETLLEIAMSSIKCGFLHGRPLQIARSACPPALRRKGASFVTLHESTQLRGCIGSVTPRCSLATDVAENAFRAAFCDPRFPRLRRAEISMLGLDVAVLSALQPIAFKCEDDVVRALRPGVDGLLIQYGPHHGLLLPAVWEDFPEASKFLQQLKMKAGLPAEYWADGVKVHRFTTQKFSRGAT